MSEKDIVEEARAILANAAHGPLELIRYEHGGGRLYREEPRDLIADFYDVGNRELYYRAPELLRALADEVERLRGGFKDASGLVNIKNEFWESAERELDEIRSCDKCDLCEDHHE